MEKIFNYLKNIDRRFIYIAMFACVSLPLIFPLGLPVKPSKSAQSLFEEIEKLGLDPGSTKTDPKHKVVLSFDYKPSAVPEIQPMAVALIRHCFRRRIKIIAPALWPEGTTLASKAFETVLKDKEFKDKKYGIDYVNLGPCVGPTQGHPQVTSLCTDIKKARPEDALGNPVSTLSVMDNVNSLKDVNLVVSLSAGDPGIPAWVEIAYSRYDIKIAGGATAVQAPQFYPYIQSRQLCGFLGGIRGAAEYESLIKREGTGFKGMDSQSFAHLLIMVLIVIANTIFLIEKYQQKKKN